MSAMERSMRRVQGLACLVFLVTAIALLAAPDLVASGIGVDGDANWGLRLAGAVSLGLAGQSWMVRRADAAGIRGASLVSFVVSAAVCILITTLPAPWVTARWAVLAAFALLSVTCLALTVMALRRGHVLDRS
jgi:hypothetical protein